MAFTSVAARQLSDGNTQGTVLGQSAADLISFFGATPVVQPSQAGQAAIPTGSSAAGNAFSTITHYTSTQSPSSVATVTTAEQSVTVTGVLATDLVVINKPTAQAGLAFAKGRVLSANTVKLVFGNVTAGTLTPTGSEAYIVTTLPANLQTSAALTPTAVAANTIVEQTFSVTGLDTGMIVEVNKPTTQAGLMLMSARIPAKNSLALTFGNVTTGTLTPTAAEVYIISAFNALATGTQSVSYGINVGSLSSVATLTTAEQSITEAGIAAADVLVGMAKPTTQAGLILGQGRISGASTAKVVFGNVTAGTLTPTASEVYQVTTFKPNAPAPMSLFTSATLTPGSVAANTTAEQTFTVTGITSGQPVDAIPNYNVSSVPGVGIAGVRASATNTIAVTFVNATATAIVPPAGTWTVAQFNQTTPTAGNYAQVFVSPLQTVGASLIAAIRSAMVNTGLIAGS